MRTMKIIGKLGFKFIVEGYINKNFGYLRVGEKAAGRRKLYG